MDNNEDFIRNYNEESDKGYFLEVDVQYTEKLQVFYNDLTFLSERMKIEKVEKLDQTAWLKPYIDMNTDLKKSKKWFWKRFF